MNKAATYLSLGICVSSLSWVAAAVADEVDLEFYGHLHVSADYLNNGNDGGLNSASNASRLGLRASHEVQEGLRAFAQIEKQVDLAEGSGSFSARDTLVGLQGDFGTLRVGHMASPTMAMLNAVEEFRDRVGDGRNLFVRGPMNLDRRYRSAINYQTPNMNGLVWTAHYGTNEAGGATVDNEQDIFGTSLAYRTGDWTFTGGYQHDNRDIDQTVKGSRFSVIRQGDGWRIAALIQVVEGLAEGDMTGWMISGRYRYSENVWLRTQFGARSYDDSGYNSTMVTVGLDRNLSSQLTWYSMATMVQNDDSATMSVTGGGYGKNLAVNGGEDPFAISTGLIFRF